MMMTLISKLHQFYINFSDSSKEDNDKELSTRCVSMINYDL